MWRYEAVVPTIGDAWRGLTMGEGHTPMAFLDPSEPNVRVKVEYMSPTLSFKDRGAVVLVALAADLGVERLVVDSSGNAGTAIAAYAARAGIRADVFVGASAPASKRTQIERLGAIVHPVEGTREDVAEAAIASVRSSGAFYASHVHNPLFVHGVKTYLYELWEGNGRALPDVLVLPVGNGTLVLACAIGGRELLRAGLVADLPRIIAVQSARCCPVHDAFHERAPRRATPTIADGIAISRPARLPQIVASLHESGGTTVVVDDDAVRVARAELGSVGFDVEHTAAATLAGYRAALASDPTLAERDVVIPLCGAGLKTP